MSTSLSIPTYLRASAWLYLWEKEKSFNDDEEQFNDFRTNTDFMHNNDIQSEVQIIFMFARF